MANPSKEKGDRWERALVTELGRQGFPASRVRQTGRFDQGDIYLDGDSYWMVEAKNDKGLSPHAMAAQADRGAANAGRPFGVVVRKSPRRPPGEAVVMMSLNTWLAVVETVRKDDDGR